MFSLHAASVTDALTSERRPLAEAVGLGLLVYVVLGFFLYLPAGRLLNMAARPYAVNDNFRPFVGGDVLLVHGARNPHPGDIVIYQRPHTEVGARVEHGTVYIINGPGVDRVLAVAGEHVKLAGSTLLVNGQERLSRPLNAMQFPQMELDVPEGFCLIWPSVAVNVPMDIAAWQHVILVPVADVEGHAFFQTSPISHWGPVR
jgi:hypothetical protein